MRKTPVVVGVAILLVAVTAGAAALLLNGTDGSVQINAAQACDLMDTPYDALLTSTTPFGVTRTEIRYSGSDEHIVMSTTDHEGALFGKGEMIIKDGVRYARESLPENPTVYGAWRVYGTNVPPSSSIPCVDTSSFEPGAAGSSDEAHLTSERFLSDEEGAVRNEFWADPTGRPTRARRTQFLPDYDEETNTGFFVTEFTYSGYDEPNTIEVPCTSAVPDQANNPGLLRDCNALLAAKDTLRGTATLNWSVDTSIDKWEGIYIRGAPRRVVVVSLSHKNLNGTVPPELARLDALEQLSLNHNRLTGAVPPGLGSLARLKSLYLSNNRLTGSIPSELGDLADLEHLLLGINKLTGEIPSDLGDLTNLESLLLSHNRLTGEIPSDLGDLSNLKALWLSANRLTGEIPSELGDLANLEDLLLNSNRLTGEIPAFLAELPKLEKLRLAANSLTGCIPPALRNIPTNDLKFLTLQNCPAP